jgi:hypothetical protein
VFANAPETTLARNTDLPVNDPPIVVAYNPGPAQAREYYDARRIGKIQLLSDAISRRTAARR